MRLSQPKSARIINRARVLCVLRNSGQMSKADIARVLVLNKVSTGEIVEDLLKQGLLHESGKVEVENGRKPTNVEIVKDAKYVLCADIGAKTATVAMCNLVGEIVKMERIPTDVTGTVEQFCVGIIKSCLRTAKLVDTTKLMGVGVTVAGEISEDGKTINACHYLPWKDIPIAEVFENNFHVPATVLSSSEALVCAEKIYNQKDIISTKPIMYLNWGDYIALAVIKDGKVVVDNIEFGHIKVANTGICVCGEIGCLETVCATWSISKAPDARLKNSWDRIGSNCLPSMAKALNSARQVVGADRVIISGDGATIPEDGLTFLRQSCDRLKVEKSALGDKANILACAEATLDYFFYQRTMLDEISEWV